MRLALTPPAERRSIPSAVSSVTPSSPTPGAPEPASTTRIRYGTDLITWTIDLTADQVTGTPVDNLETVTVTLVDAAPVDGKLFVRVEAQ